MFNKKFTVLGLAIAAMGLTACGGSKPAQSSGSSGADLSGGASITYWCPNTDTDFFAEKVKEFKAAHPEYKGEITNLATVGEGDVKGELTKDAEKAADVFEIADDNIKDCVEARAMTAFGKVADVKYATDLYGEAPVAATTVKGNVYGLPYRNDNGYVLSYDSSIVSETQAQTIEGIIAACKAAGATFNFDLTNSWYTFAPVWAAGGKTYTDDEGVFHSAIATDEIAEVVGAFGKIVKDAGATWNNSDSDDGFGKTDATKVGAVIKWNNYDAEKKLIGDKLKVTVLPSFKAGNGVYKLKSFQGFKALGMRKAADFTDAKKIVAVEFCKFMGSDAVAEARLTKLNQGVSNKAVAAKTELWTSPWLQALAAQGAAGNTISQANGSSGTFWDAAGALGNAIKGGTIVDKASAKEALQICQTAQNKLA